MRLQATLSPVLKQTLPPQNVADQLQAHQGIVQLHQALLQLQGQGQQGYYAVDHPGFASTSWHDYRIIVAADPGNGGTITAKVYLDGNYAAPILTRQINASALNLLRVGDQATTLNGIFDLDSLRFSDLYGRWAADGDGSYGDFGNWSATIPAGVDAKANFLGAISASRNASALLPASMS